MLWSLKLRLHGQISDQSLLQDFFRITHVMKVGIGHPQNCVTKGVQKTFCIPAKLLCILRYILLCILNFSRLFLLFMPFYLIYRRGLRNVAAKEKYFFSS